MPLMVLAVGAPDGGRETRRDGSEAAEAGRAAARRRQRREDFMVCDEATEP